MPRSKHPPVEDICRSLGYALKRAQQTLRTHLDNALRDIAADHHRPSVVRRHCRYRDHGLFDDWKNAAG